MSMASNHIRNMFVTNKQRKSGLVKVKGYIFPEKKEEAVNETDDSDEENEAEQQPEFLDLNEINNVSTGGHSFQPSVVPLSKADFYDFKTKKVYCVEGRFALRSPWWEVNCHVRWSRDKRVMKGYPSYKLRSDLDRKGWISILSLFLNACGVEPVFIQNFFDWLPKNRNVTFSNLDEVVEEFSEGNEAVAQHISSKISSSVAGMQVRAASLYPGVMKYIPTLLPRQFVKLLGRGKKTKTLPATQTAPTAPTAQQDDNNREEEVDTSLLAKLELIIADDVWKLGFNQLMLTELKLVRCEASLKAFEECELLQKIPLLQHHALLVYHQLKTSCQQTGSTYIEKDALCELLRKNVKMSDEQAWSAIHFLREQNIVVVVRRKIVLKNFDSYETGIAECLSSLMDRRWNIPVNATEVLRTAAEDRQLKKMQTSDNATTSCVEDRPSVNEPTNISNTLSESSEQQAEANPDFSPIKLDPDHVRAVEMICANPVTIISGKAGCGKTTVVSSLFKAAVSQISCGQQKTHEAYEDNGNDTEMSFESEEETQDIKSKKEILLTAPTGRAASLLKKKTGFPAYTLHQVLFSFMKKQTDEHGDDKQWSFKDVRIFVADEGSMVSVQLFHTVLKSLVTHANLQKVIILGDVRQLPSIQPGNILHDLYDSLTPLQWVIEMRTNHRSESQLIIKNAGLVADMGKRHKYGDLNFDAIVDLEGDHNTLSADKKFILIRLPEEGADDELQKTIKFLINTAPGLDDHYTSQFIAFKRCDVALINELCCTHYNNHTTKNHKNKLKFQPGDKVCCTKNGYITDTDDTKRLNQSDMVLHTQMEEGEEGKEGEEVEGKEGRMGKISKDRLCNGEIFFIRDDKTEVDNHKRSKRYLTLDDNDGRQLTVEYRELQRECKLQHAWARTIHTFQGSENETIVYVVGDSKAQTWKHIYTAITRGQKRVYVVAREDDMKAAIQKRETPRNTRLASLIKDHLVQPNTPQRTPSGCTPQKFTPLHTQAPNRPSSCDGQVTPLRPKGTDDRVKGDTTPSGSSPRSRFSNLSGVQQLNSTVTSQGNKRVLFAEHQEVPCKQPRVTE